MALVYFIWDCGRGGPEIKHDMKKHFWEPHMPGRAVLGHSETRVVIPHIHFPLCGVSCLF